MEVGAKLEAGAVRNADEWFRLMVVADLAPGLRDLGLEGDDRHFRTHSGPHVGQVSILQTAADKPRTRRFTLLLTVTTTSEWSSQLRIRPYLRAAGHTGGAWQERIGDLIRVGGGMPVGDLWWPVEAGKPFAGLAKEAITAVREFGMPAMLDEISTRIAKRGGTRD